MSKNMALCAILSAFAVFVPEHLPALPFEELVWPEHTAALRTQGSITGVQLKNPAPLLLPRHNGLRQFVTGLFGNLEPSLCVETLFLYKKNLPPESSSTAWTQAEQAELFNQVLAISSLTGIQYYSASRGAMRTFYESSFVIDGPDGKRTLPDPVYASPPATLTLYARQKDLTFGNNVYRYDYRTTPDAFFFVQENLTAMTAGIIPAVGKNKLRSVFAVIDCGDTLLIYAASLAKAASVPGMGERIGNSFTNRAEAIVKWFKDGADKVMKKP